MKDKVPFEKPHLFKIGEKVRNIDDLFGEYEIIGYSDYKQYCKQNNLYNAECNKLEEGLKTACKKNLFKG